MLSGALIGFTALFAEVTGVAVSPHVYEVEVFIVVLYASYFMLIGLFQQNTTGSVAECRGRFFRKPCKNSSRSLPVKTPAESTWAPVAGRMGSYVRDASTGGPIG